MAARQATGRTSFEDDRQWKAELRNDFKNLPEAGQALPDMKPQPNAQPKEYCAFMRYSSKDRKWVNTKIEALLETGGNNP